MGQGKPKHQMWPLDPSLVICLMDGKALMQGAEEQVLGGPLSLLPGFWGSPEPDPLSCGRGSKALVYPAVCKQLKKVMLVPHSSFLAQAYSKNMFMFYQHLRRMLSHLSQKSAI